MKLLFSTKERKIMSDYTELIEKQKKYYNTGATRNTTFRKEQLKRLYEKISLYEERINEALWKDLHKGAYESYLTEVGICKQEISHAIRNLKKWARPKRVCTSLLHFKAKSFIHSEPYGQTLIIAPWNYPFQLIIGPLAGAIAAGNTVILKPSELASATESIISEIISELYDEEYIACRTGGAIVSQELLKLKFDHIFFTGSPRVGKYVMEAAAKNLVPITLELGGKSPVIVDETANIDLTARRLTWGKFLNGGQTCIAPDYLFVHESVKDNLVKRINFYIEKFYGENPQESPDYLRIINEANTHRLKALIKDQKILTGGNIDEKDKYISPTLIDEPALDSPIMTEEIFGPVLPILSYDSLEKVIEIIAERDKPLAMYIFSNSRKNQKKLLANISAGNGAINDVIMQFANANLPFGGVGSSGMGSYHGKHSFTAFSHQKSILNRSNLIDVPIRYAPYKSLYFRIVRKLIM